MKNSCPICEAPSVAAHAPFCSRGCKDRDLLRWLDEGYRIPGPPTIENEGLDSTRDTD
jgi:uncharacterized protein